MPKGNGQNNNEEEKDIETVSVNNSKADEEEEKTEEQIDNEEEIDNDNDDGDGDEKEDENEEEKSEEPQDEDDKLKYENSYAWRINEWKKDAKANNYADFARSYVIDLITSDMICGYDSPEEYEFDRDEFNEQRTTITLTMLKTGHIQRICSCRPCRRYRRQASRIICSSAWHGKSWQRVR